MRNKGIDKLISAAGTILFVGLIQTSEPSFWAFAGLSIGLYECCLWACRIARREAKRSRRKHYITTTKIDIERWADQQFNPYREVS